MPPTPEPVLSITAASKRFGEIRALDGVDLEVRPGECLGLLGPNGAGKSTLMSAVCGLQRLDGGRILIGGRPCMDPEARGGLGLVPQNLALYPDLTARENLSVFGSLAGLRGAELGRRCSEALEAVRLSERKNGLVRTFSGGMARRLNLAAALLHRPSLLLCDEPTVGVDPQSRNAIFELLRGLAASGTTLLYSTHFMEEASKLCSRIAIIDRGRILDAGTERELLDRHRPEGEAPLATLEALFLHLTGTHLRD